MRPIYKSVVLESAILAVSLSLQAEINDGSDITTVGVYASTLDGLRVELASPKVSGALDLIASGAAVVSGSTISVTLGGFEELATLEQVTYRLTVKARYGTQVRTLYALDITVPRGTLAGGAQEYEDSFAVVSTFGDGGGGGADATVYALDGDGNAYITKPLSVSGNVQEGSGTTASGANSHAEGSGTISNGINSHAEGKLTKTNESSSNSHAEGYNTETGGDYGSESSNPKTAGVSTDAGTYAHAEGNATIAYGLDSHSEGRLTFAKGSQAHAEGSNTKAIGIASHSEGAVTTAHGNVSHAEGRSAMVNPTSYAGHAEGNNTETGGNHTSNTKTAGTETGAGAYAHAEGNATIANGVAAHSEGVKTLAKGDASHAEGNGTIALQNNQHACGRFNVGDTGNAFLFIVGNGTDDTNRHNAFAVTKSGELALFKSDGTPVILDVAKLEALIASV